MGGISVGTIISLVVGLIKLANLIFGWLHDSKLIQEGKDQAVAEALAEMARRTTIVKAAADRVEKMSDKDVLDELGKSGDLRDD
jgi:hypothetical protein